MNRKDIKLGMKVKILGTKGGKKSVYEDWINVMNQDCCLTFYKKHGYLYVSKIANENVFLNCQSKDDVKDDSDWTFNFRDISEFTEKEPLTISTKEPLIMLQESNFTLPLVNPSTIINISDNTITLPKDVLDYELEELLEQIKKAVDSTYEHYSASTFREFMISKCAIWCKTIEQAKDFLQKMENMMIFNITDDVKENGIYNNICYSLDLATNEIIYNTKEFYKIENKKIVKF